MAKTTNDLSRRVMQRLNITQANEDPQSEDHSLVVEIYRGRLASLREDGIAYWPEAEIPDAAFNPLVMLIAADVAPDFGLPMDAGLEMEALRRLRAHVAKRPSGEPVWFPEF